MTAVKKMPEPQHLSRMALARIVRYPQTWDQGSWHCGTTHCYGGHCDLIIQRFLGDSDLIEIPECSTLKHDVAKYLDQTQVEFNLMTHCSNTLEELIGYHDCFYRDNFNEWYSELRRNK